MVVISKNEVRRAGRLGSIESNAINDRLWNGEFIPVALFNDLAGDETEEIIRALKIAGGSEADWWNTASLHGVGRGVFFVGLAVGTKWSAAVFVAVKASPKYKFTCAEGWGDTSCQGEIAQPHDNKVKEMNQYLLWEGFVG